VPLLLLHNHPASAAAKPAPGSGGRAGDPSHAASGSTRFDSALRAPASSGGPRAPKRVASPTTTATSAPTPPPAPAETTLPAENVAEHVVVSPTTTVVTAPPAPAPPPSTTTTTAPPAPAPVRSGGSGRYGQVTYYAHPAGTCASPWLPFGTAVRITNPANGESVTCVVDDREADTDRSIDLATDTFALIAPLSQGVIDAELTW
jgi:rare lipoprotein A